MLRDGKHSEYFLAEAVPNFCSLACCMGVLNYFWSTSFNGQNTRQMMNLFKEGLYTGKEMLDLPEIACKLDQLWFNIDYYISLKKDDYLQYVNDPQSNIYELVAPSCHQFIKIVDSKLFRETGLGHDLDISDMKFEKKILNHQSIFSHYNVDIVQVIRENQRDGVLFLVGLDYYTLNNEPIEDGIAWGHVILVSKIEDDHVVIFDPGPPLRLYHKVPVEHFMRSVEEMWKYYSFMKITDKNAAYSSHTIN